MTRLGAALDEAAAALKAAGFEEPRRRARRLVAAALDLTQAVVFGHPERALSPGESKRVRAVLDRTLAHEPLSRIEGRREFWGLDLDLGRDTLDPRPETETLVEAALRHLCDRNARLEFLDLGTGSGAILLALLHECPAASGLGIDIAEGAAATARGNAAALGLARRACFVVGDWAEAVNGRFDLVVANPPYIAAGDLALLPPEVAHWDPRRALDGGADGLDAHRRVADGLPRLLHRSGFYLGEIGAGQAPAGSAILAAAGLAIEAVVPDLAGRARVIIARLI